jgi:hypothetical protein
MNVVIWNAQVGFIVKTITTKVTKNAKGFISSLWLFLRALRGKFFLARAF